MILGLIVCYLNRIKVYVELRILFLFASIRLLTFFWVKWTINLCLGEKLTKGLCWWHGVLRCMVEIWVYMVLQLSFSAATQLEYGDCIGFYGSASWLLKNTISVHLREERAWKLSEDNREKGVWKNELHLSWERVVYPILWLIACTPGGWLKSSLSHIDLGSTKGSHVDAPPMIPLVNTHSYPLILWSIDPMVQVGVNECWLSHLVDYLTQHIGPYMLGPTIYLVFFVQQLFFYSFHICVWRALDLATCNVVCFCIHLFTIIILILIILTYLI